MKRKLWISVLLCLFLTASVLLLCACERPEKPVAENPETGTETDPETDPDTETVTVTYYFTEGDTPKVTRTIKKGDPVPEITPPEQTNFLFLGWNDVNGNAWDFDLPAESDLSLYAEWEQIVTTYCQITFVPAVQDQRSVLIPAGELVEEPMYPLPEGMYREGWYTDAEYTEKFDLSRPVYTDMTLYEKQMPVPVTISFVYDKEELAPIHTHYGEEITLPAVKEDGKALFGYGKADAPDQIVFLRNELTTTVRLLSDTVLTPVFVPAWSFEPINDGTEYRINHFEQYYTVYQPETEVVTLPSSYEGKPVTEISPGAFKNNRYIRKLIVPGSYRTIGKNSFYLCYQLEEVILEEGVQSIELCAFDSCTDLQSVSLPQSLREIQSSAFSGTGLLEADLPAGLETIGSNAFYECFAVLRTDRTAPAPGWAENWSGNCTVLYDGDDFTDAYGMRIILKANGEAYVSRVLDTSLTSLEIPAEVTKNEKTYHVTKILDNALYELTQLQTLFLPDSLEWLGKNSLPNSLSLQYTQKDGMTFLGSRSNPYLVLCFVSFQQQEITVPAQTRIVYQWAAFGGLDVLRFEENSSLSQIGEEAFSFSWAEPFDLFLPPVKYLESNAFQGQIPRIFYAGEGEHWAADWDENACAFDLTKGQKYTDGTGEWFLQEGEATLLRLTADAQAGVFLPSTVTAGGQTYRVTRVVKAAFYEMEIPFLYIPDSVTFLDGQNLWTDSPVVLLQADTVPDAWQNFNPHPIYLYCGIDGETLLSDDGTLYLCANGTARALSRYEYTGNSYLLPRSVQGVPVDGVLAGFLQSVQNIHLGLTDSVLFVQKPNNAYATVLYAEADEPPAGWEEGWNLSNSGTPLTVYFGVDFPRESRAEFTFVTEGTAVAPAAEYFLPIRPESAQNGKYFWGWYENADYSGENISFPYFGTATTLYARFETERKQDGTSKETAIELKPNESREIFIGAGKQVFLCFAQLTSGKTYLVKSMGDADTYGEIIRLSSVVASADGGGAGENFSITFSASPYGSHYLRVILPDKNASATVQIIYFET